MMNARLSSRDSDPVSNFCVHLSGVFGSEWPVEEAKIASEFVRFFDAQNCNFYPQLLELCSRLSIEVHLVELPAGNCGINVCYRGRRAIFIREAELLGLTKEHTLLHELREILEHKFRELGYPVAGKEDLEERAELFATFVRIECAAAMWSALFGSAGNLRLPWKRGAAYVLAAAGAIVHLFSVTAPCLEYLAQLDSSGPHD